MRVLLGCSLGGEGHLIPLASVARTIERAGHQAIVLVPPSLARSAQRIGLSHRVGDEPPRAFVEEIWQRVREGPAPAVTGVIDRELFADRCTAAMLDATRALRDAWRPDLVVREPCEYASAVAALEGGIPQAQIGISLAAIEFDVLATVTPIIDRFAPGVASAIASSPYMSSFPPSLDPSPWPDTRRVGLPRPRADGAGEWSWGGEEPLVYVTFGSVIGHLPEASGTYRAVLEAVAGLSARVLLTVGRATAVASIGPVPANTLVEPWVDQDAVLGRAAVVVCHGGSGTTFGALAAGVPLVICPLFADQSQNGEAVRNAGAGVVVAAAEGSTGGLRSLGPEHVAPLRESIQQVLLAPAYRQAAGRIAAEMAAMPALDRVTEQLLTLPGAALRS